MDRISVNSQIHFGKPCLAWTRITVQSVLELLNEGLSLEAIIQDYYPILQVEDITENELVKSFVIVKPHGHRFRRLP